MNKTDLPKPPSKRIEKYWNAFIEDVVSRRNFKPSHLEFLRVLCELMVIFDDANNVIVEQGMTYESDGRYGFQIKDRPEVKIVKEYAGKIKEYSQLFDIRPMKDTENKPKETDEWK